MLVPLGVRRGGRGAAVQCAKIAGARVIATVGDPAKVPKVLELGPTRHSAIGRLRCARLSPSSPAAAAWTRVIDTVGGELFGDHLGALAPDGRLATWGRTAARW